MEDYRAGRKKPTRTSRGHAYHDTFARRADACDVERVRDEMSGIGPGSSGRRDGVGTGRGTSHNTSRVRDQGPT